jgi:hypothetical protein
MYRSLLLAAILAAGALSNSANACGIGVAPDEDPEHIEKPQKTSEPTSPDAAKLKSPAGPVRCNFGAKNSMSGSRPVRGSGANSIRGKNALSRCDLKVRDGARSEGDGT